jgi:AraC-like DNA-binding protein
MTVMSEEAAHYWRHPGMPSVDLLRARFVTHRYGRHTHPTYVIGLIESGVEEFHHAGSLVRAGTGQLALLNPEVVHTGQAGVPEGWSYRVLYPSVEVVQGIAAELGGARGTPYFPQVVTDDAAGARLMRAAHQAAEGGDRLASSSLTHTLIATMLRRHGAHRHDAPPDVPPPAVRAARDLLHERLVDPPSLEELAATVGSGPFALLRAFRSATGLPPHAYLTLLRVRRARSLLDTGIAPAEVAVLTGFADQAHLTRHFKKVLGVPPGAYQRNFVQDGAIMLS